MYISQNGKYYGKMASRRGPVGAFDALIRSLRKSGVEEDTLADVALRFFMMKLRSANDRTPAKEYVLKNYQQASKHMPAECIYDGNGWIFYGAIKI
jgi:hypothetical protein